MLNHHFRKNNLIFFIAFFGFVFADGNRPPNSVYFGRANKDSTISIYFSGHHYFIDYFHRYSKPSDPDRYGEILPNMTSAFESLFMKNHFKNVYHHYSSPGKFSLKKQSNGSYLLHYDGKPANSITGYFERNGGGIPDGIKYEAIKPTKNGNGPRITFSIDKLYYSGSLTGQSEKLILPEGMNPDDILVCFSPRWINIKSQDFSKRKLSLNIPEKVSEVADSAWHALLLDVDTTLWYNKVEKDFQVSEINIPDHPREYRYLFSLWFG